MVRDLYDAVDDRFTEWMGRHGVRLLRVSVGIVFLWFGVLKYFPGLSPAQTLATNTMHVLTLGFIPEKTALLILATWECLIGLGLIAGVYLRATLFLLWLQMMGTITPLFFFPEQCFTTIPYAPTLEGQYIIKIIVLISAGIAIGATHRRGRRIS